MKRSSTGDEGARAAVEEGAQAAAEECAQAAAEAAAKGGEEEEILTESDDDESEDEIDLDGALRKDSEDGDGEDGDDAYEALDVTFDMCEPRDEFRDGIWGQVKSFPGVGNPSDMADEVLNLAEVTTLVTAPESDDHPVFGMLCAMKQGRQASLRGFVDLVAAHCPSDSRDAWRASLASPTTAVLVSTRMINLPMPLIPAMYKCFIDDVRWATTAEELPASEREGFATERLVLACPIDLVANDAGASAERPKKKAKGGGAEDLEGAPHYFRRYDEEFIVKDAAKTFRMSVTKTTFSGEPQTNHYLVAEVSWDAFVAAVEEVARFSQDAGMKVTAGAAAAPAGEDS